MQIHDTRESWNFYDYELMNKILWVSILLISDQLVYNMTGVFAFVIGTWLIFFQLLVPSCLPVNTNFNAATSFWVHYNKDLPATNYIQCLNFMEEKIKPDVTERCG